MQQCDQEIYEETLKDKLTLGPVDKYEKYNRFPFKYILQMCIILGTSYQGFIYLFIYKVRILTQYNAFDGRNISYAMNQQIFEYQTIDYVYYTDESSQMNSKLFMSLPDFFQNIQKLFEVMGSLDGIFFTELNQTKVNLTQNRINVFRRTPLTEDLQTTSIYNFNLSEPIQQPFNLDDPSEMKEFLKTVAKFTISFGNIEFLNPDRRDLNLIQSWIVTVTYTITDFQTIQGEINSQMVELDAQSGELPNYPFVYSYYWMIHLIVLIMTLLSLLLHIKYIMDMVTLYTQTKFKSTRLMIKRDQSIQINPEGDTEQQFLNPQQDWMDQFDMRGHKKITKIIQTQRPWNMMTLEEKLLFLDAWVFVTIIGNLLQSFTCMVLIFNLQNVSFEGLQLLMGFSCFFAWLSICRYVEYQNNVYILTYLLKYSLPTILRFILGVLPFFVGYAILGLTLFYRVKYFANFQRAFVSLICLSYGNQIYEIGFFLGENLLAIIFVVTYSVIFLLVFQNILMTIFVVIVYNKFDAQVKQQMLDHLQTRIPNLRELLLKSKDNDKSASQDLINVSGSQLFTPGQSYASPGQNPLIINANEPLVFLKNFYATKIKSMSKKIEKSLEKMSTDLNDDLKIFLITKKQDKQYVKHMNEVCLDYLFKNSQKIIRRAEKLKSQLNKE